MQQATSVRALVPGAAAGVAPETALDGEQTMGVELRAGFSASTSPQPLAAAQILEAAARNDSTATPGAFVYRRMKSLTTLVGSNLPSSGS